MRQIEIDAIKEFAGKMREFGYGLEVKANERATRDFITPDYKTEVTLSLWKRAENKDTFPWNTFNLSFLVDNLQKRENEE